MNEHIKLLKEQAMEWVPNMADPDTKIRLLNAEKFAQLIVRECIEQVITGPNGPAHYAVEAAIRLKKHFGVEE